MSVLQKRTAVTAYFSSKQLLLFAFALPAIPIDSVPVITGSLEGHTKDGLRQSPAGYYHANPVSPLLSVTA